MNNDAKSDTIRSILKLLGNGERVGTGGYSAR